MDNTKRTCEACDQPLVGRVGKRYCSNQCRAAASNRRRSEDEGERLMKEINHKLRHNRFVLQRHSPEGKTTLRREVLQVAGFDFRHFTHLYRTKQGNTYHFCYDYGYFLLPDEKVLIVNWQPYMEQNKV
ncbi:hypothetical protein [uncultured Pontibacter sp.]|uniref:hypothetical protein n=1 Tax=uncultured Pontibacter sp. TaxID=453356 RepID=UPI00261FEFC0|nr:hypothetical protein [uncultured Pontibacter sp.]